VKSIEYKKENIITIEALQSFFLFLLKYQLFKTFFSPYCELAYESWEIKSLIFYFDGNVFNYMTSNSKQNIVFLKK
jgi:hypothetical protein